jgi:hypothetical protein
LRQTNTSTRQKKAHQTKKKIYTYQLKSTQRTPPETRQRRERGRKEERKGGRERGREGGREGEREEERERDLATNDTELAIVFRTRCRNANAMSTRQHTSAHVSTCQTNDTE